MSEDDAAWVQWRYSRQEWAQFDAWAWDQDRRSAWQTALLVMLATPGIGLLVSLVTFSPGSHFLQIHAFDRFGFSVCVVAGLIFGPGAGRKIYLRGQELHLARQRGPRAVSISPWCIRQADTEVSLLDYRWKIRLREEQPSTLHFYLRTGGGRWADVRQLWIMVPRGREGEARHLVRRLEREPPALGRPAGPERRIQRLAAEEEEDPT